MPLDLEMLLNPDEDFSTPAARQATAAALRKQYNMGTLGQLMGTQPTVAAGGAMQEQAQGSLKMALAKQQAQRESAIAAAAAKSEEEWKQRNFDQRDKGIEATRVNQAATRAGSGPIIDTPGGKVRVTPENTTTPIMDPTGTQVPSTPKAATADQNVIGNYASQFEMNLPVFNKVLDAGYLPGAKDTALGTVAGTDLLSKGATAFGMSPEGKLYYAAAKPLVNAIMRRESGAAISATEWAGAFERWLPQFGDPPEVVAQKRASLNEQLEILKRQAGPAYAPVTARAATPAAAPNAAPAQKRVVNGKTYIKQGSEWFEE